MDIQVAVLCDAAADYGGKLSVLGVFDTVVAARLPAVHPHCAIALRFVFRKEEEGDYPVRIRIVDEDGGAVVPPIQAAVRVEVPDDVLFVARNAVLNLQHLQFVREGLYSVEVEIGDGQASAAIPLQVRVAEGEGRGVG